MDKLPRMEVLVEDSRPAPSCPHGPTLLFKRTVDGSERLFYACSACRDRKDCRFFRWADEEMPESKIKFWELEKQRILPKIQHAKLYVKLMKMTQSSINRIYCHDCSELVVAQDINKHAKHDLSSNLSEYQLTHPSELLKPLENPKKEAQYMFSKQSTKTIVSALQSLGVKHVICIGAPRIHESILSDPGQPMDSLLLDIDHRYHNFHGPLQFCWFNAFNNHFFNGKESAQVVADFLQQDGGKDVAVVIDPPFGGRVEPLAKTIQLISEQHQSVNALLEPQLKVMWIFPYFMETHIQTSFPDYTMLDYKVDYVNHPLFATGPKGRKFGSPVRIFTNISAQKIALPVDEGYVYCKPCKRWSSAENKHCKKCASCPSKDGRTYIHCNACKRCVKPSWQHCDVCKRCCQQMHKCGVFKPSDLCYHCGEAGHKKADCEKAGGKKRKLGTVAVGKLAKKMKKDVVKIKKRKIGKKMRKKISV